MDQAFVGMFSILLGCFQLSEVLGMLTAICLGLSLPMVLDLPFIFCDEILSARDLASNVSFLVLSNINGGISSQQRLQHTLMWRRVVLLSLNWVWISVHSCILGL